MRGILKFVLIWYPATLLYSLINSSNFLVASLRSSIEDYVICKQWEFCFFLSNLDPSYFCFFSEAVSRTSKAMLNRSCESGHLCLVPDFRVNAFNFSPLRIMFTVGLSYMALLCWVMLLLCLLSREFFYHKWYWILSKASSASVEIIIWFLSFNFLIWCITLTDLQILKNPASLD